MIESLTDSGKVGRIQATIRGLLVLLTGDGKTGWWDEGEEHLVTIIIYRTIGRAGV